jgi:hypothetical protein
MLKKTINHQPSVAKRGSSSKKVFFTPQYLLNEFLSDTQYMIWSPCYTYGNMVPEHARGWHGSFPKLSVSSWTKNKGARFSSQYRRNSSFATIVSNACTSKRE